MRRNHIYRTSVKRGNYAFLYITVAIISFALCSCFTGIESTKKINLSREDRKLSHPSPEQRFMDQIQPFPLKEWDMGKQFVASDNKALFVIVPQGGILPVAPDSIKGKELSFSGVESKINAAGDLTLSILFTDNIYIYAYDTGKEFDDAMENITSDRIPMLIDLDMVENARALLLNQKFWTKSNLWYDNHDTRIDGKKYVEVEITNVEPGNMVFPLKVEFKDRNNRIAYMFMNLGNADNESRSFHNLFSMSDIKKNYPSIDAQTWDLICQSQVKEGMTKEECKLALGNPNDINSGHDYSQTLDIWRYDNGKVLWFEDGRLVKIRQ